MNVKKTTKVILKAVALAMGVATLVLSVLGKLEVSSAITFLGIGLVCLAVESLQDN